MSVNKKRSIEIPLTIDNIDTAKTFIEQWMDQNHIKNQTILETLLLFESLFYNMIEQGFDQNTLVTIKPRKSASEVSIKLGFEGAAYVPGNISRDDTSPEYKIMEAYNDRIDYRYRLGYNSIRVVVKRNYRRSLLYCVIGIVTGVLVSFPVLANMCVNDRVALDTKIITPLISQFANAMLMVGAPVTFFSLVKNLTDIYISSEKSSSGRRLQIKTIVTSIISIFLAVATSFLIAFLMSSRGGYFAGIDKFGVRMSISEFISSVIPNSIFEPFETYMPFPIIIVALLITYAFCLAGEYFDVMQKMINACYRLFSQMLNIIMFTLPFFCFLSILSTVLRHGYEDLVVLAELVALVFASLIVMAVFYIIRLKIGGVKIGKFSKHLIPLIWENFKINSAIDAVPFNIRYCARKYGYNRKRLSAKLPILAQTNLDGNCYLIMLISMLFIFLLGIEVSWLHIVGIVILILFLSIGAPNQPGSILIGMLIITFFLKANELITIAIYAEVFFGALQNIINVVGDIVTVAIEEQKAQ